MSQYEGTVSPANLQAVVDRLNECARQWADNPQRFACRELPFGSKIWGYGSTVRAQGYAESAALIERAIKQERERILTPEDT